MRLRRTTIAWSLVAATLAVAVVNCSLDPFVLAGDGGVAADVVTGDASGLQLDTGPLCVPPGTEEICNELDDDCDGVVDNGFDKQNDPSNCGTCGNLCAAPNASVICVAGECVLDSCQLGFADLDPAEPGCEYQCPVYPPQAEDCNGLDEDCDGDIDEPADLPAPPQGLCRVQVGTPCANVSMICTTRGSPAVTTWYCDYPPEVEFDPALPNGIALEETLCDGHDGDCDGAVDESFGDLGQECDNGGIGACRDVGLRVCDTVDATATVCDLTFPPDPDPLAPRAELCNDVDDNCDGVVDNPDPSDPDRVVDDMVRIQHHGIDVWVYRYEASRPDATALGSGASTVRACSRPDVLPWANVTYDEAVGACGAVGKRLCAPAEWLAACEGASLNLYPYGPSYVGATCNGVDHDGIPGGGDDDVLLPTGDLSACVSEDGLLDLSGNLREWTDEQTGVSTGGDPIFVVRGGEFHTPSPGLTCDFTLSQAVSTVILPTIGFRCCSDLAP
jgi:Sulfatase-modifying factor enzyme 1/Putative metal-binding motif